MSPRHTRWWVPALTGLCVLLLTASCTPPRREKPSRNPEIVENMRQANLFGFALSSAIDEAALERVRSTSATLAVALQRVQSIPPRPDESGTQVKVRDWNERVELSLRDVEQISQAATYNRWDIVQRRYNTLRLKCIKCHDDLVDRPIDVTMPPLRNYP